MHGNESTEPVLTYACGEKACLPSSHPSRVCVYAFSALTSFSIHPPLLIVSFPSSSLEDAGCQDQL